MRHVLAIFFACVVPTLPVLAAAATAPATAPTRRAARMPADLKVVDHIVFKQVGDEKLELMLFPPAERKFERAPLVVYIHGGGWSSGDRTRVLKQENLAVVRELTGKGVVCASIEYRLNKAGGPTAMDCAADCKDAIRFLVKHADEYGIDPQRVGTFGGSAGGHLTLVTALGDDGDYPCDPALGGTAYRVRCVAAFYPLVSMEDPELMKGSNFERRQRLVPILGGPLEEKRAIATKLSPIGMVREGSPAIFLAHGDADVVLNYRNSIAMRDAAQAKGVPVECVISKGAGHGFSGANIEPAIPEISHRAAAFMLEHLMK